MKIGRANELGLGLNAELRPRWMIIAFPLILCVGLVSLSVSPFLAFKVGMCSLFVGF